MNKTKTIMRTLNRAVLTLAVCLITLTSASALTNETHRAAVKTSRANNFAPSADFDKVWVDYDTTQDGEEGMLIHLAFTTYGMKNLDSAIRIGMQKRDGTPLKDNNKKFYATSGSVAVFKELKPGYPTTAYKDLTLFMPYDELDLAEGNYSLKMDIDLIYEDGTLIQHFTYENFTYDNSTPAVSAKVIRTWVDYDVTQDGRKGMRIHVNFEVTGLKGVDSMLAFRLTNEKDEYLKNNSSGYSNESKQMEINYSLNPGYATTVYEDANVFLPYSEINIGKGVWSLNVDIDLERENHEFIQHLTFHEFEFTK